jgi:siroheme synthase-like protein
MNPFAAQFPVNLNIEGKPVLLVGGGRIAYRKAEQLLVCEPQLTVISPQFDERFHATSATLIQREYATLDVMGFSLVITATANNAVDQQIFDECESLGIWVNSADDPDRCTFTLPASMRRGRLLITSSTAGASPAMSSWVRSTLENTIGPEFAEAVELLAAQRAAFHAEGVSTEDVNWAPLIAAALEEARESSKRVPQ